MDLTPCAFSDSKYPHRTTAAHELALPVVLECGLLHFADSVRAYRELPAGPKQFLREIPVVWDETRLLAGEPGAMRSSPGDPATAGSWVPSTDRTSR